MYVRDTDHRRALSVLDVAGAARTRQELVGAVMPALRALMHADEISHSQVSVRTGRARTSSAYPTPTTPQLLTTYLTRTSEHPYLADLVRRRRPESVRLSELRSLGELQRSAFYRDFYRPRGVRYADYQSIAIDAHGAAVGFGVCRRDRDFTDDEHDLFEHVRRPLGRVWLLVSRVEALDAALASTAASASASASASITASTATSAADEGLSPAERRVAELVLRGWRTASIATTLGVSAKAVEQHLTRIYRKAAVRSRAEYLAAHRNA